MSDQIDDFSKKFAQGMTRKETVKLGAKGLAAAILGALGFAAAREDASALTCGCRNGQCCTKRYYKTYTYWDCSLGNDCRSYDYCGAYC